MVRYFAQQLMRVEEHKHKGVELEKVLADVAWLYEHLIWGLQDEWKRLPDSTASERADIFLGQDDPGGPFPLD